MNHTIAHRYTRHLAERARRISASTLALCFSISCLGAPNPALASGSAEAAISPSLPASAALAADPSLTIPIGIPASTNSPVDVPITFAANGNSVSSLTFSIDFDETLLSFDDTDADMDGIPDDIVFSLPGAFFGSASYDASDTDGEIDIVIFDPVPPLATLPDGVIVTITFTTGDPPSSTSAAVDFSTSPSPSGGTPGGSSLSVTGNDGSVQIGPLAVELDYFRAAVSGNRVLLEWRTLTEFKNAGFNLYRKTGVEGDDTRLNATLIASHADELGGAIYRWEDSPGRGRFIYRLESIDTTGASLSHDPRSVIVPGALAPVRVYLPWTVLRTPNRTAELSVDFSR